MNDNKGNNDDKAFLLQLQMKGQQKAKEYAELLYERQRLDMHIERTKTYIEHINAFLEDEGQRPIILKEAQSGSTVGKPGNRSKAFPLRQLQWEGMSINQIIGHILNSSPNVSFHHREIVPQIYEIESESDLLMVTPNIRSTMQSGARNGLWDRTDRAKFRAKEIVEQGKLVQA